MKLPVSQIIHPDYRFRIEEWNKWRLVQQSGRLFINAYLEKSAREDPEDFICRKKTTYCPAFSKTAVNEVKDSIYQRMSDIIRTGGTKSFQNAVLGLDGGIDSKGSSMNYFMGCRVLPELLFMGKVGIYVDMPPLVGSSIADNVNVKPYIYYYRCENIKSWVLSDIDEDEFESVLLTDYVYAYDENSGFPIGIEERYRHIWRDENGLIWATFYDTEGGQVDQDGIMTTEPILLNIKKVPFTVLELSDSLLTDIADYQVALLNVASTDMSYILKANFPFYTEQYDPRSESAHLRGSGKETSGEAAVAASGKTQEITVGVTRGRRYPLDAERPDFIHPSSEPITASMQKQEQLKNEIRQLLKLTIANLQGPKMASAESKGMDYKGLETGLSYIGLTLENCERKISQFWSSYEGSKEIATINYPQNYDLNTDVDRQQETTNLKELLLAAPSLKYQKEIIKRIAKISLGSKVSRETFDEILKEIDNAEGLSSDPAIIIQQVEAGLVGLELASKNSGYPKGEVAKAKSEHAERLARINAAQSKPGTNETNPAARGVAIADPTPGNSASSEKKQSRDTTSDGTVGDKTRGQAK